VPQQVIERAPALIERVYYLRFGDGRGFEFGGELRGARGRQPVGVVRMGVIALY
jgi:hypothetical protein